MATVANFPLSQIFLQKENTTLRSLSQILFGIVFLSVLARISIPLPFSPVPLTGQTLGVFLISLTFGRTRGSLTLLSYLGLGFAGFPIFSGGLSGLSGALFGPTFGYLIGMFAASIAMGSLADRGFTKTFTQAFAASALGSVMIFSFGLFWLSFFVPKAVLLSAGLLPFVPGDLIKMTLAASMVSTLRNAKAGLKAVS